MKRIIFNDDADTLIKLESCSGDNFYGFRNSDNNKCFLAYITGLGWSILYTPNFGSYNWIWSDIPLFKSLKEVLEYMNGERYECFAFATNGELLKWLVK